jgi:hypothetical protein
MISLSEERLRFEEALEEDFLQLLLNILLKGCPVPLPIAPRAAAADSWGPNPVPRPLAEDSTSSQAPRYYFKLALDSDSSFLLL